MGKLINDFLSTPIPPEVWHYTNLAGFEGIISSGRVWATEAHHTTDKTEFIHARDVAARYLERLQPQDESTEVAKRAAQEVLVRAFDEGVLSPSQAEIFVASFCAAEDLGSQWEEYGAKGRGMALSFDLGQVRPPSELQIAVTFAPCLYRTEEKERMLEDALSDWANKVSELHKKTGAMQWAVEQFCEELMAARASRRPFDVMALLERNTDEFRQQLQQSLAQTSFDLLRIASHCKDETFYQESEWRLALPHIKGKPMKVIELLHRGTDGAIPYVAHNLFSGRLPVVRVKAGPLCEDVDRIKGFLKKYGYDVPVERSTIPIRSAASIHVDVKLDTKKMIDQISIQNFRGFASLRVSGLKRINVIVGKNATGKTAFLESIFMSSAGAAPALALSLRRWRQLGNQVQISPDPAAYEGLWEELFHWYNQVDPISIEIIGTNGDSRSLRISYTETVSPVLPFGKQPVGPSFVPQILFEWRRGNDTPIVARPRLTLNGLEFEGATAEQFPSLFFGPHIGDEPEDNAKRLSNLSKTGKDAQIAEALRSEYPFLDSLSIEYSASVPAVFATFTHHPRKLPIALVSDGINKLLGLLLGIASHPRGVLLVDQIEDGFYFDRMPSIWKILYEFASANDVQIFASSHNIEYLRAMLDAMRGREDDFALLHAERENGYCSIRTIKGKFLQASLEEGVEVR